MEEEIGTQVEELPKEEVKEEVKEEASEVETSEPLKIIDEAKKAADDLRSALAEKSKLLEREEKLLARQETIKQLGGGSLAGGVEKPKEETPKEYAKRVMEGKV